MVLSTQISQIWSKLIKPKILYTPLQCFNRNQVDWLFNSLNQISIKYFHVFHIAKVMFWQANVHFINDAVSLTLQSILICKNIVNVGLKMFRISNWRLSDQIRRAMKTKIFAHLEISRGHHLNICGAWKFPGGLALPVPWKFPGPGNIQGLEISRLCQAKLKQLCDKWFDHSIDLSASTTQNFMIHFHQFSYFDNGTGQF